MIIILLLTIIALQVIIFHKLNKLIKMDNVLLETLQAFKTEATAETTRVADLIESYINQLSEGTITVAQLQENLNPVLTGLRDLGVEPPPEG
jgi:hypothetical protein